MFTMRDKQRFNRTAAAGRTAGAVVLLSAMAIGAASAQEPFRGKQVTLIVGTSAGGGYDTFTRTIAPHLRRHLPGQPNVLVQNMPGAGSVVLANHLYNIAPKDGTSIGNVNPQIVIEPLVRPGRVKYDPSKMAWIGSALRETHVSIAWHTTPIHSFDDLFKHELVVAGTGGATDTFPMFVNGLLGTKFKIIDGYPGMKEGMLAMERGEVAGNGGITWASAKATIGEWLETKKVRVFVQYGLSKHPELPNVPWIYDYAKTADDRAAMNMVFARQEYGRPYVAPPGLAPALVETLRRAFDATMKDPEFLADADKRKLDIDSITGEQVQDIIADLFKTTPAVVERVKTILGEKG
jgi:tripartite-type tricarboxylate transporter receptor subunit TctC